MHRPLTKVLSVGLILGVIGGCNPDPGEVEGRDTEVPFDSDGTAADAGRCGGYLDENPAACRANPECRVGCDECRPATDVPDGLVCGSDARDSGPDGRDVEGGDADTAADVSNDTLGVDTSIDSGVDSGGGSGAPIDGCSVAPEPYGGGEWSHWRKDVFI